MDILWDAVGGGFTAKVLNHMAVNGRVGPLAFGSLKDMVKSVVTDNGKCVGTELTPPRHENY